MEEDSPMAAAMRPPIDPEAGAVLAQFGPVSEPVPMEGIPAEREARRPRRLTDDDLRRAARETRIAWLRRLLRDHQ
jgi:hypothetical protein